MTRREKKAATHAALLTAAREHFMARGFERPTIREISASVGASTGAIYSHWANKAELYEASMRVPWPDPVAFAELISLGIELALDPRVLRAECAAFIDRWRGTAPGPDQEALL